MKLVTGIKKSGGFRGLSEASEADGVFGKRTIIYGRNGSGKSTIADMMYRIQARTDESDPNGVYPDVAGCELCVEDDGDLPPLIVFNREYVEKNVFGAESSVAGTPMFVIGEVDIALAQLIKRSDTLRYRLDTQLTEARAAETSGKAATDGVIKRVQKRASEQFGNARSPERLNGNAYSNTTFTVRHVRTLLEDLEARSEELDLAGCRLDLSASDEPPTLPALPTRRANLANLHKEVSELCTRKITYAPLEDLGGQLEVEGWVKRGLDFHHEEDLTCRFCRNALSPNRHEALLAHFNDSYSQLSSDLFNGRSSVALASAAVDDWARFLPILKSDSYCKRDEELVAAADKAVMQLRGLKKWLEELDHQLESRQNRIGDTVVSPSQVDDGVRSAFSEVKDKWEALGIQLKEKAQAAKRTRKEAEQRLLGHIAHEFGPDWDRAVKSLGEATAKVEELTSATEVVEKVRTRLVAERASGRQKSEPVVNRLNVELAAYFSHKTFSVVDETDGSGFVVYRDSSPALHLSEGEQRGIALLFFLEWLRSDDFGNSTDAKYAPLEECCVVVDDPVTSFDDDAVYYAVQLLHSRLGTGKSDRRQPGQAIITTHNSLFLRRLNKDWLRNFEGGPSLVSVSKRSRGLGFDIAVEQTEWLKKAMESDYHLVFREVAEIATSNTAERVGIGAGNAVRRLYEGFAKIKVPHMKGLAEQVKRLAELIPESDDKVQTARLIALLAPLHGQSHGTVHSVEAILSPEQLRELCIGVLAVIKQLDEAHFEGMLVAVGLDEDARTIAGGSVGSRISG